LTTTLSPNLSPVKGERLKRPAFNRSENGKESFASLPLDGGGTEGEGAARLIEIDKFLTKISPDSNF
jgi:hypothetical protein